MVDQTNALDVFEEQIGYQFRSPELIGGALHVGKHEYNRLKFLGDRIVNDAIARHIFIEHPQRNGRWIAAGTMLLTTNYLLAAVTQGLAIHRYLTVPLEYDTEIRHMYADVFEALVAAIFLDRGDSAAFDFTIRTLAQYIERELSPGVRTGKNPIVARVHELATEHGLWCRSCVFIRYQRQYVARISLGSVTVEHATSDSFSAMCIAGLRVLINHLYPLSTASPP